MEWEDKMSADIERNIIVFCIMFNTITNLTFGWLLILILINK
jgi:hypothetical protein